MGSGGDLIIYAGTDPAAISTFDQKGSWFVGGFPKGRRLGISTGGDLLILTVSGVISMNALNSGQVSENNPSYNVTSLITSMMETTRDMYGWEMTYSPETALNIIQTPKVASGKYIQICQHVLKGGWGTYFDFPMVTGYPWRNEYYGGTSDSRVLKHTGDVDGVTLAGTGATPIQFKCLTRFHYLESSKNKQASSVTPRFISKTPLGFTCFARYNFDLNDLIANPSTPSLSVGIWGTSLWNQAIWGAGSGWLSTGNTVYGATGIGTSIAVGILGKTTGETILAGFELTYEEGGYL
jgi:hypothetical protein